MQDKSAIVKALTSQITALRNRIVAAESGLFTPIPSLVERDRARLADLEAKLDAATDARLA
jgi:hypothetical protein